MSFNSIESSILLVFGVWAMLISFLVRLHCHLLAGYLCKSKRQRILSYGRQLKLHEWYVMTVSYHSILDDGIVKARRENLTLLDRFNDAQG